MLVVEKLSSNLFASPNNLLEVILGRETLNGSESLTTVSLLNSDVN